MGQPPFLEHYLLHDGETHQRLDDLKLFARGEGVPWSSVEYAARKVGVIKTFDLFEDQRVRYWRP